MKKYAILLLLLTAATALSASPGIPAPKCMWETCCNGHGCSFLSPGIPAPKDIGKGWLSPGLPAPCLEGDQRYVCTHQKK